MRRWAFVVAVLGMFVLLLFLGFGEEEVGSYSELQELEINSRVVVSGEVVSERVISGRRRLLELDSGIVAVCECVGNFAEERVEILGVVSEFEGERQVEVLRIAG